MTVGQNLITYCAVLANYIFTDRQHIIPRLSLPPKGPQGAGGLNARGA